MRNSLAWMVLGIALAVSGGCDDQDTGERPLKTARHRAASTAGAPARVGADWRAVAADPVSVWGFAAVPVAAGAKPLGAAALDSIRAALDAGMLPPKDNVRITPLIGLVGGGSTGETSTAGATGATISVTLMPAPWNDETTLLWIAVAGLIAGDPPRITIAFDPGTVAAFRPIGDPSGLPAVESGPQGAAMLYELSLRSDIAAGAAGHYAILRIAFAEGQSAPPLERGVTGADRVETIEDAPDAVRFAAAVAGFGELLRGDPALRDMSCDDVIALARGADQPDPDGLRAELIRLMERAEPLIDLPPRDAAETPASAPDPVPPR